MSGWTHNGDGTSTFVTSHGPITVPTPRLDNSAWGDDISDITTQSDGYHEYAVETTLGFSTEDVTLAEVQEAFSAFPTPFGSYFAGPGFVSHYEPDDNTVINITRQLHALDPGIVLRQIVVEDGQYKIITYGMGTGIAPGLNEDLAPLVWGSADISIAMRLNTFGNMASENSFIPEGFSTTAPEQCFGPEASISMWPLDPEFAPDPNNPFKQYDQDAVRAKIWKKPIELIRVGDYVVSHDKNDNMVPGYVPRTMSNQSKVLLNFHGTPVTPGHVYYRPDSKNSYKYETLIDVLRDDGMIEHSDRIKLRAATNVPVGTPRDGFVQAVTGTLRADGGIDVKERGRIRLGTRFLVGEGKERKSFAVADLIEHGGGVVGDDELIRVGDGEPMQFHWDFSDTLPKPEDFVLACSSTTLEDIYKAAEWESQGPRLAAPMVLDRGPVQPLKGTALSAMPRNEPLDVVHSPMASAKPQRTLNRKQRKAMEGIAKLSDAGRS